ncbi:hypothetical protein ACIFUY_19755 [Streptomyces sp. CACIS-1.16CA]
MVRDHEQAVPDHGFRKADIRHGVELTEARSNSIGFMDTPVDLYR